MVVANSETSRPTDGLHSVNLGAVCDVGVVGVVGAVGAWSLTGSKDIEGIDQRSRPHFTMYTAWCVL